MDAGPKSGAKDDRAKADRSDQLSPAEARRESLGASEGQRLGDNEPLANPVISPPVAEAENDQDAAAGGAEAD
jgi:hypothetical protein